MEIAPQKPRRSLFKVIAVLLFVFLLGNLTGIGGSTVFMLERLRSNFRNPAPTSGPANRFLERTEEKIAADLKLSATERQGVHEEFQITRRRLAIARLRMLGELRALTRDTVDRAALRMDEPKRQPFREAAAKRLRPWGIDPENE